MSTVGYATLQIIPSAKGFGSSLDGAVGPSIRSAGSKHGRLFGHHFAGAALSPLRALGGVAVAALAVDKIGGFLKDATAQARENQQVNALTAQVIKTTGGAANISAKQIGNLSTAISNKVGIDDEAIQSGANLLLTFTSVRNEVGRGNDIFSQATRTATDMSAALGQDMKSSAIQLGKALNDPIHGVTALQRVGVSFTTAQKKQIAGMVKHGETMKAQKLILGELNREFGGAAKASTNAGAKLSVRWSNLKEQLGTAILPTLDKLENAIGSKVIPAISRFFTAIPKGIAYLRGLWENLKGGNSTTKSVASVWKDTIHPALALVWGFVKTSLIPALMDIWHVFQTNILPVLRDVAAFIIGKVVPTILGIYLAVAERLKPILDQLIATFRAKLLPAIVVIYAHFRQWLPTIERVAMVILKVVGFVLKLAAAILGKVLPVLIRLAGFLILVVVKVLVTVIGWVVKFVGALLGVPAAAVKAYNWVKDKLGALVGFFAGLPGKIAGVTRGMFDGIKDAFKSAINWIISKWNDLSFHIGGQKVFGHKLPSVDINTPNIPLLAEGGIATRATLGVFGEAGPEAILPLSKLSSLLAGAPYARDSHTGGAAKGPLVGSLTLVSSGNVHDDLEETVFTLRRIDRGGAPYGGTY